MLICAVCLKILANFWLPLTGFVIVAMVSRGK